MQCMLYHLEVIDLLPVHMQQHVLHLPTGYGTGERCHTGYFPQGIQVVGFIPWGMQREDLVDPDRYEHLPGHAAFRLVSSP